MAVLVEFSCTACGRRAEEWIAGAPLPASSTCTVCGAAARRQFGGRLLTGTPGPARASAQAHCADHTVPASCALIPTAARTLAARVRGDNRALDAELALQEAEIVAGRLDPRASVVAPYPGARPAAPTASETEKEA